LSYVKAPSSFLRTESSRFGLEEFDVAMLVGLSIREGRILPSRDLFMA